MLTTRRRGIVESGSMVRKNGRKVLLRNAGTLFVLIFGALLKAN